MICTIRKITEYKDEVDQQNRLNNQQHLQDQPFAFASDFSGMDCQAYTITKLRSDLTATQIWISESEAHIREFITMNYRSRNIFNDVTNRQLPPPGQIQLYTAGPPCQGISSAGPRKNWQDSRTLLYMHSIVALETTTPDIPPWKTPTTLNTPKGAGSQRPSLTGYGPMDTTSTTKSKTPSTTGYFKTDPGTGLLGSETTYNVGYSNGRKTLNTYR